MFLERKKVRYRILSLFIRFWDFIKSTQVHIHTTHVPLVVYLANLTVLLGGVNPKKIINGFKLSRILNEDEKGMVVFPGDSSFGDVFKVGLGLAGKNVRI